MKYSKKKIKKEFPLLGTAIKQLPDNDGVLYRNGEEIRYWESSTILAFIEQPNIVKIISFNKQIQDIENNFSVQEKQRIMKNFKKRSFENVFEINIKHLKISKIIKIMKQQNYKIDDWHIINFIRHELTNYDELIAKHRHRKNFRKNYHIIVKKTFKLIKRHYPEFSEMINEQLHEHLSRKD